MIPRTAFAAPAAVRNILLQRGQLDKHCTRPAVRLANARVSRQQARTLTTANASPGPRAPPKPSTTETTATRDAAYKLALLYDSDCPLCLKEVNFLQRRVEKQGPPASIKFVDIASPSYKAEEYGGIDYETAMGRIHGIRGDGTVVVGVPVFREAYDAVGLGWVYSATKIPPIGAAADAVYNVWADWRLQLTGRPPLEQVMQMRRDAAEKSCREEGDGR